MEGHLIAGHLDGGDSLGKPLELVPDAFKEFKPNAMLWSNSAKRAQLEVGWIALKLLQTSGNAILLLSLNVGRKASPKLRFPK